ncbi:MAG TPA: Zn-dependent hydrolase [Panacibacter sp.]|nr:Zn-dependent hydrolase [Panacibacter sp.]HNP42904.1 Zn-dependent hydrolase [Panacibacter sp.]
MQYLKPAILVCLLTILAYTAFSQPTLTVNQQRIEQRIFELAKFGKDSIGRGYRVAYTKGDIEGRNWFIDLLKKAGLEVSIDYAGNIVGKRKGKNPLLQPIAFGSHIDMVPDGGNYDGCFGSISALEIIEVLNEKSIVTEHPLEVIIFSNEEGGTVGSKAMSSGLSKERLQQISQSGLTIAEGISRIGGNPENIDDNIQKNGAFKAFLELHIEQGGILAKENTEIGVVEGIVGIKRWEVTVAGFANHAGSTSMDMRQDALLAASKFVVAVNEVITSVKGSQVGTVGKLEVEPGAYNVIPGKVVLGLEIRDLSAEKIDQLFTEIKKRAAAIAAISKTTISFELQANPSKPALTDKTLQQLINKTATALGFSTKFMQSGAGHDAQQMALLAPAGMIFIPSAGGISHSPKEFSTAADMANGANVLLQTILTLDKEQAASK